MITIVWTNAQQKAAGMGALAGRIATTHTRRWGEGVGKEGAQRVREVIQSGGMNPTKKGGPRIKSGDMIGSADHKVDGGGGSVLVTAGLGANGGTPPQSVWQEGGTRRGISPMLAIPEAAIRMETATQDHGMKMLTAIRGEWDSI